MTSHLGSLTFSVIACAMRSMVREAIREIQSKADIFETTIKVGSDGVCNDIVTTADIAAQKIYIERISLYFPTYGIICEETGFSIPCTHHECDIYFTVDSLDGTKAYVRKQSHGIGTVIAFVIDREVEAAYIGDVMTGEIYGYYHGSPVLRIRPDGNSTELSIDKNRQLSSQRVFFQGSSFLHKPIMQGMISSEGLFGGVIVEGSSMSIDATRLWKGEVGAIVLSQKKITPWDDTPIIGISREMGFIFFEVTDSDFLEYQPKLIKKECASREKQVLIIHESRRQELLDWNIRRKLIGHS